MAPAPSQGWAGLWRHQRSEAAGAGAARAAAALPRAGSSAHTLAHLPGAPPSSHPLGPQREDAAFSSTGEGGGRRSLLSSKGEEEQGTLQAERPPQGTETREPSHGSEQSTPPPGGSWDREAAALSCIRQLPAKYLIARGLGRQFQKALSGRHASYRPPLEGGWVS